MSEDSRIAVIGLGYVGLPLAIAFAEAGLDVEGVDASRDAGARAACRRSSPIDDITDERLSTARHRVGLSDHAGPRPAIARRRTPSSCACRRRSRRPRTPTSGRCARGGVQVATTSGAGQLIVLQSTTFPGTTTGPFREVLEESGLKAGRRLRPRLRARAGQPRRPRERRARRPAARRRARRRRPRARRGAALGGINDTRRRSCRRPTPPRWPSCSRTRSATSTSRS